MDVKAIIEPVSLIAHKVAGKVVKHSPEILLGSGIAAMVAGCIVACESTTKAEEVLDTAKQKLDAIHEAESKAEEFNYTKADKRQDLVTVYIQTAVGFVKTYWKAIALELVGIACILGSYGVLHGRNVALTAAATAWETSFSEYRQRVRDKLGDEADDYFKTGMETKAIEILEKDENGNEKKVKSEQKVYDDIGQASAYASSTFARWFDESCDEYVNDAYRNMSFLMGQQKHANRMLKRNGYLFLNDVYDMLGIPRCPQGQAVGWLRDNTAGGQGYVDFGIHDGYRAANRDFVNGYEKRVLLDFNIDPQPIWDKI